jgi:hypothetical protein
MGHAAVRPSQAGQIMIQILSAAWDIRTKSDVWVTKMGWPTIDALSVTSMGQLILMFEMVWFVLFGALGRLSGTKSREGVRYLFRSGCIQQ